MTNPDTLQKWFEMQTEQMPDAIAVTFAGLSLTYAELNSKANQLAHYLIQMGIKPDDRVALCMDRSIDLLVAMLGIVKAGGAYLPLDARHPSERLSFILNDNNSPFLLTHSYISPVFSFYQGKLILGDNHEAINKQLSTNPEARASSHHLAYVIYTSGSTGKPKGVLIEQKSLTNYCAWFASYCGCKPGQLADFSSSFIFDMAVTTSITALLLGLTLVVCPDEIKNNISLYLQYLHENKINLIKITPGYFKVLLHEVKENSFPLPHLQTIILGGENLIASDCLSWLNLYPHHCLYNEYGPTEATVAVSQYKITKTNASSLPINVPIGKTGENMHCYLLDSEGNEVADGEAGELYIGGICLARGYLNQPEMTKSRFISHPGINQESRRLYQTGDLCRRLPEGTLEYLGRIDDQVKIRGFRIEPSEIEQCLERCKDIDQVAVLVQENRRQEKYLVAYYIPENRFNPPDTAKIRQHLQNHLPEYMIPAAFVCIAHFPLTANGKLDRKALPIPQFTASQQYSPPTTALEKTIANIWKEELGIKKIGLNDDFFELGGHSLSAARIISKINQLIAKDISLQHFYQSPNIKSLTVVLNKQPQVIAKQTLSTRDMYQDSQYLPLNDFQFMLWLSNTFEPKAKKLNIISRKRINGRLDTDILNLAFEAVLNKHEVLLYRPYKLRPAQALQENITFKIDEENLESKTDKDSEHCLTASMDQLIHYYPWPKDSPLLTARLFHLKDETDELQICMAHIVSDDATPDILLSDLSEFYLLYKNQGSVKTIARDKKYRAYLFQEQFYTQTYLDRDIAFWEEYLQDARLFRFPSAKIIRNANQETFNYSTYLKIPESSISNLKKYCSINRVSINDGLCAALALAMIKYSDYPQNETQTLFMNVIKSTRNEQSYDDTIGCFLRLEPLKIAIDKQSTLSKICRQIHLSAISTSPYQRCSSLVKLACLGIFRHKNSKIRDYFIKLFTFLYTSFLQKPQINRKILNLCARLSAFERANDFIINVNVQSNFVSCHKKNNRADLFGLSTQDIKLYQYDLLTIDHFFDVCFIRTDDQNTPYLVISANIQPEFRVQIAQEILHILAFSMQAQEQFLQATS